MKCRTISDYFQEEDIDIITALQMVDTTVKTLQGMRNNATFKQFYDQTLKMASEMGIEVNQPRP